MPTFVVLLFVVKTPDGEVVVQPDCANTFADNKVNDPNAAITAIFFFINV
jgi:hypothetical protein